MHSMEWSFAAVLEWSRVRFWSGKVEWSSVVMCACVCVCGPDPSLLHRDENSQPFSIRKICQLTPKWRKAIFKSIIKGLKSQNINRNQSVYA